MKMIHLALVGLILFGLAHIARGADYVEDITQYGPTLGAYVRVIERVDSNDPKLGLSLSYLQGLRHMWMYTFAIEGWNNAEEVNPDITFGEMLAVTIDCIRETPPLVLYKDLLLREMKPSQSDQYLAVVVHDVLQTKCQQWLKLQKE